METKTKRVKLFYIKERHNPQLDVYYIAEGQLSKAMAKRKESSLYGYNIMRSFETKDAYDAACKELNAKP